MSSKVSAGTAVDTNVNVSAVSAGDRYNLIDVFVNGQLLVSGTEAQRASGAVDYLLYDGEAGGSSTAADVKFAFDVEIDDVIQVVVR